MTFLEKSLRTERVDDWAFRCEPTVTAGPRLFGGALAGQGLVAAYETVDPSFHAHAVHCQFVGEGQSGPTVEFQVTPLRDGRSSTSRRVDLVQGGSLIMTMLVSFTTQMPSAPAGDLESPCPGSEIVSFPAVPIARWMPWDEPFDVRFEDAAPSVRYWIRPHEALPEDAAVRAAAVMWITDLRGTYAGMYEAGWPQVKLAGASTLNHTVWIHQRADINAWLRVESEVGVVSERRPINRTHIFDADGQIVASCIQEGLVRVAPG